MKNVFHLCVIVALLALPLSAQTIASPSALPRLHFTYDHPDMPVIHYEIDVDAHGKAHYESKVRNQQTGGEEDGVSRDFVLSTATRDQLFQLAKAANRMDGSFDFTKHKIAFSGNKTISYTDERGTNTAKFMWSENETLMKLASLFQGISGTLEEEPILRRLSRYDRLGLNAELGKMESLANSGWLREINLISGVLKEISSDSSVMNVARQRANRLLQVAAKSGNET